MSETLVCCKFQPRSISVISPYLSVYLFLTCFLVFLLLVKPLLSSVQSCTSTEVHFLHKLYCLCSFNRDLWLDLFTFNRLCLTLSVLHAFAVNKAEKNHIHSPSLLAPLGKGWISWWIEVHHPVPLDSVFIGDSRLSWKSKKQPIVFPFRCI